MRFLTSTAATKLDALDAGVWGRFVAQGPQAHLLQTWAWGELKERFGWRPVRVAVERDGALVAGTYVHGLFDQPEFRRAFLNRLRARKGWAPLSQTGEATQDAFDRLAEIGRQHLDIPAIYRAMGLR